MKGEMRYRRVHGEGNLKKLCPSWAHSGWFRGGNLKTDKRGERNLNRREGGGRIWGRTEERSFQFSFRRKKRGRPKRERECKQEKDCEKSVEADFEKGLKGERKIPKKIV